MRWREQDTSRSMVALVASLGALALLGLVSHVPRWLGGDNGFSTVTPGLLTVEPDAKGVATLGGRVTVSLYSDGLRIMRDDQLLLQTVVGGSMLSAVDGTATRTSGGASEDVTRTFDNVRVDELVFLPGRATYFGSVSDGHDSLPFTMRVELEGGGVVRLGVDVNGADGVVWHLDRVPLTIGLRPAMLATNLRGKARWMGASTLDGQPAFSTMLGTDVGAGPMRVPRGVDARHDGRTDIHVWSGSAAVTVVAQDRPLPQ